MAVGIDSVKKVSLNYMVVGSLHMILIDLVTPDIGPFRDLISLFHMTSTDTMTLVSVPL